MLLTWIFSKLFFNRLIHFIKQLLIHSFFIVPVVFLISGFFGVVEENVSINWDMEDQLLYLITNFEHSILKVKLTNVMWCLWIVRCERFNDLFIFLFSRKLFLLKTHISLIHEIQILIVLKILRDFLLNGLCSFFL